MKKSLIVTLALVFVLGIAGTAFAAANPFSDVPAKHWAYDAVAQLAKDGIVEGYGDGTFKGDKTMTRYEMAIVTAKALAKSEKANAAQKAMLDKLSVEFATELNNLGVRVAKLEANQPNLKFTGALAIRYNATDFDNATSSKVSSTYAQYRLRLDGTAKVDDKTSVAMRFVTREPNRANIGNDTWQTFGENGQSQGNTAATPTIDRINLTTSLGVVKATVGRQALKVDPYDVMMDSGAFSYDGVKFTGKSGVVDITVNHGRFLKGAVILAKAVGGADPATDTVQTALYGNLDVDSIGLAAKTGKLNYGLSYFKFKNPVANGNAGADIFKWTLVNASYLFDSKFSLGAQYAKNGVDTGLDNKVYAVKAIYGNQVLAKKGDNNIALLYAKVGAGSMFNGFSTMSLTAGNTALAATNYKQLSATYTYAWSKSFNTQLDYAKLTPDATNEDQKKTQVRVIANVMF